MIGFGWEFYFVTAASNGHSVGANSICCQLCSPGFQCRFSNGSFLFSACCDQPCNKLHRASSRGTVKSLRLFGLRFIARGSTRPGRLPTRCCDTFCNNIVINDCRFSSSAKKATCQQCRVCCAHQLRLTTLHRGTRSVPYRRH